MSKTVKASSVDIIMQSKEYVARMNEIRVLQRVIIHLMYQTEQSDYILKGDLNNENQHWKQCCK